MQTRRFMGHWPRHGYELCWYKKLLSSRFLVYGEQVGTATRFVDNSTTGAEISAYKDKKFPNVKAFFEVTLLTGIDDFRGLESPTKLAA